MSVTAVSSDQTQTLGSLLLQQVLANGSGSQDTSGASGVLGDLMTLSPAARQLTQAPDAVVQAMRDLLSGQTAVPADLAQLKSYFQQNPQSLSSLLSSLQGSAGTYGAASSKAANSALLTALLNGQSNSSDASALLGLLSGSQGQSTLFDFIGNAGSASSGSTLSIFG